MLRSLLQLVLLLLVGIVLYNYFLGTPEERKQSEAIFREVGELGKSVVELVKSEKEKFDAGKYDRVLEKIGGIFRDIEGVASDKRDVLDEVARLEAKRRELLDRLGRMEERADGYDAEFRAKGDSLEKEQLKRELDRLVRRTERLIDRLQASGGE